MIPVSKQPEPPDFDAKVRKPGSTFLSTVSKPKGREFKRFWQLALDDLRLAYKSICAYSCCWIGQDYSVDHFLPKGKYPKLAYEWDNFRFCSRHMNERKDNKEGILDPFAIQTGWFVLNCGNFHVEAGTLLPASLSSDIKKTIEELDLNCDSLVELRYTVARDYSRGDVTLQFLQNRYPFVWSELQRQNLTSSIVGTIP